MSTSRRSARVAGKKTDTKVESLANSKVTKPKKTAKKTKESAPESPKAKKSEELEVGDEIPDLTLSNQDAEPLSLTDLASKNDLIIIFAYPKASTPGCTRQACGFRDNYNDIKDKALVLGLSADAPKAQLKFKTNQKLQYDLLSDENKELITLLGAKKLPNGIKRSYWIFQKGKLVVKRIQVSPEISITEGKAKIIELSKN